MNSYFIARLSVWSLNQFGSLMFPNSQRMRRRRKLGIGEVFIRALAATFLFALFISPIRTPDVNFLKIGNLLVGFPFLVVVLHKILC